MGLFLLTAAAIAAIMLAMAVGLFFRYPCLRGSCGGEDVLDAQGESLRCAACPKRRVTFTECRPGGRRTSTGRRI